MPESSQPSAQSELQTHTVIVRPDENFIDTYDHTFYFYNENTCEWYSGSIEWPFYEYSFELPLSSSEQTVDLSDLQSAVAENNKILSNVLYCLMFLVAVLGILVGQGFVKIFKKR